MAGGSQVSYRTLYRHAAQLAERLLAAGVRPGELVVIALPPGEPLLACVLATLLTGAAHLLADPAWPPGRLSMIPPDQVSAVLADPGTLPG